LVLYNTAVVCLARTRQRGDGLWAVGLLGVLAAQSLYSMTDAVAMGSKVNLFFWLLFGLIFAVSHHTKPTIVARSAFG